MTNRPALVSDLVPFLEGRGYEPGERVPSERELAERFRVSRNQIREALSYLEALRVVERRSKSGVFMASDGPSLEAMVLFSKLGLPVDKSAVRQAIEMRRIHEIGAVQLAAQRRTDADIETLRSILAAEQANVDAGINIAGDDREFHLAIIAATHNPIFLNLARVFYAMSETLRETYFRDPERQQASHREHQAIFDAIEQSDAELASRTMRAHLAGAESRWETLFADGISATAAKGV